MYGAGTTTKSVVQLTPSNPALGVPMMLWTASVSLDTVKEFAEEADHTIEQYPGTMATQMP